MDYETNKTLNDVGIFLDKEEMWELSMYLQKLIAHPEIQKVHLSQVVLHGLEKEITFAFEQQRVKVQAA